MAFSPLAQPFALGEGLDACLLIHGFTGSPAHMRPLGEALAGRGFFAEGILLPGHGTHIRDMEASHHRAWLACARAAALRLRRNHRRVYAIGLSMGGVLSLLLAQEGLADAVVSLAAPMRIYAGGRARLARFVWPFLRYQYAEPRERSDFLTEYDQGYAETPVRRIHDLLTLMRRAERGLPTLTCPLLAAQSLGDEIVRPVSADLIYARARSAYKELVMVDHSPHVLTLGQDRERLTRRVCDFLRDLQDKA